MRMTPMMHAKERDCSDNLTWSSDPMADILICTCMCEVAMAGLDVHQAPLLTLCCFLAIFPLSFVSLRVRYFSLIFRDVFILYPKIFPISILKNA